MDVSRQRVSRNSELGSKVSIVSIVYGETIIASGKKKNIGNGKPEKNTFKNDKLDTVYYHT